MNLNPYNREPFTKNNESEKNILNQDIILGIAHNEEFPKKIEEPRTRLTGDKVNIHKNQAIIHSNSTKRFQNSKNKDNLPSSNDKNINIININVNNLIITNSLENKNMKNKVINNNNNNNVFSKLGSDIINNSNDGFNKKTIVSDKKIINNNMITKIRNKSHVKPNKNNNNNIHLINKNNIYPKKQSKEKYNQPSSSSNIQGIIDNLIQSTRSNSPLFSNMKQNQKLTNNNPLILSGQNQINHGMMKNNGINNNLININKDDEYKNELNEDDMEFHFRLWESLISMELHSDNKLSFHLQVKKFLELVEKFVCVKESNIVLNIFKNSSLNYCYKKILKIGLSLVTYFKFLLIDFNFENTIKSNVKKLISILNENLLNLLASQIFIKDNISENELCSKISKELIDNYNKIIKMKKIKKKNNKNDGGLGNSISKNLDIVISSVKQFSNNFFKIGYFKPIHSIFFDILRLIDTYKVEDVANIVINGVLYYINHINTSEKNNKAVPKIITYGMTNNLAALGFINVPSPFLQKLPPELESMTYTLVLDLDETLVHFFYTPSGGTFLIRPYCFEFLEQMSKYFEIVIFTAAMKEYADSILDIIDPDKRLINYRLYRHHTTISGISFVKDLSKIGRDLNRIIIVDNLADNFKLQQNNGIQIGTWIDDMKDTQLNDLGKILIGIVNRKPDNIRNIIKKLKDECHKKLRKNINANPFKDIDVNKYFK